MRSSSIGIALLIVGCSIGQAQAQSTLPTRDALITMLSGFESTPTLAQMRALGDGAVPMLIGLYDDPTVIQPVRLRAVEAMGAYTTPEAHAFLLRVMREPAQSPVVIREAIEALQQSQGASAVSEITPLLSSPEYGVREAAIEALGRIGDAAARRGLTAQRARETDATLRARIDALLATRPSGTTTR